MSHVPVLLAEVLDMLVPANDELHVDGTFGGGGYTRPVLAAADCHVFAIDRDLAAIDRAETLALEAPGLTPVLGRFGEMDKLLAALSVTQVDGVMLDIGVSSFQIDEGARGFSFMRDGPLDMRMGQAGPSAADIVNQMAEADLARVIYQLGEERQSRRIARALVNRRVERRFETTLDLADTIERAVGGRRGKKAHPATLTFQALRMFVNDELGELARGLGAAERLLRPGGRLVVVTFHSLEDRLVKTFFRSRSGQASGGSRYRPELVSGPAASFEVLTRKAVEPGEAETTANPRARSARLRAGRRTGAPAWGDPVETGVQVPAFGVRQRVV